MQSRPATTPLSSHSLPRRHFLGACGAAALTTSLASRLHALPASIQNQLGLQLWTVRNQLEEDRSATLKAIADAGYYQVELMNVVESTELVKEAHSLGLKVHSAFFNWETIANPGKSPAPSMSQIIDVASQMELDYLVFGYIGKSFRDTADKLKKIADSANEAAELVAKAGMKLSYHNHSFEFEQLQPGLTGYDILIERFDSKLINFELDVFWAAIGGWDPVETLNRLGKRTGQIHLKDLKADQGTVYDEGKVPNDAFQEVGDGVLEMEKIVATATGFGVTQFHVEQDQSPNPIQSIGQSIKYVQEMAT